MRADTRTSRWGGVICSWCAGLGSAWGQADDAAALAEALIARGRSAEAAAVLERLASPSPRARYLHGFALIQLYRYPQAEAELRAALSAEPERPDWRHALARTLLEQGRNRAALEELERALGQAEKPQYHFARAMCLLNLGRLADAEPALEAALALDPSQSEALYQLGRVRLDRGNDEGALAPLARSLELNPHQIEARFLLGLAQRHRGEFGLAADAFEAVLQRVPGHVGALFNSGAVLAQLGREAEAAARRERFSAVSAVQDRIEFLKAGVRKNPAHLAGRLELAGLLLEVGRTAEALVELNAARRLEPRHPETYRLLARALRLAGDETRAVQAERAASELEGGAR